LLIHEIYHRNVKINRTLPARSSMPFKIVYATDKIEIDDRTVEEFMEPVFPDGPEGVLCKHLAMPMSTASTAPPLAITGPRTGLPYVMLVGSITCGKNKINVRIEEKAKKPTQLASVSSDLAGTADPAPSAKQLKVSLKALSGYRVGTKSLEEVYNQSKVFEVDEMFVLPKHRVEEVCNKLFSHIVPTLKDIKIEQAVSLKFIVYVLPARGITYAVEGRKCSAFVDVFGIESTERAPNKPTFSAKFLSSADRSFVIKCHGESTKLYDRLGLSKKAYMHVNLHKEDMFWLSGLWWYFGTDRYPKNRKRRPRESESGEQEVNLSGIKSRGFYDQIRDMAEVGWRDHRILCIRQENNKYEILLDEHCPILTIRERLLKDEEDHLRYCSRTLESLILETGSGMKKKLDWGLYIDAVRSLIHGRKITRHRVVSRLSAVMREKMRKEDVNSPTELAKFFKRGLFCLEAIAAEGGDRFAGLRDDEHFAYRVGQAAMLFARFRNRKSPIKDALLTRPVYDRATLRVVLSKVVSGIALQLDDTKATTACKTCARAISWTGKYEIPEKGSRTNLSYFFYAGAFSVMDDDGRGNEVGEDARTS